MKNKNIITVAILSILSTTSMATEHNWEVKLTPSIEQVKSNGTNPSYTINSLSTAIGYNLAGDQIELSLGMGNTKSPINETNSSIGLGYEKLIFENNQFSSTFKASLSREFANGDSSTSYSFEPKVVYKGENFEPFFSINYGKTVNVSGHSTEYALGAKFDLMDTLAIQPSVFKIKDGEDKSSGFRVEIVKSF